MKLLIFGATGGTGKKLIEQALAQGHQVTAFVRNANKLRLIDSSLTIVEGELFDYQQIRKAMEGQDAVISTLGNKTSAAITSRTTVISEGLQNIITAMKECRVARIVFVTSFGVSEQIFWPEKLFIKIFLRNIFADLPKQEQLLQESGLQWTIIRPARLVNGSKTTKYHADEHLSISPFSKISRADVADFLLKNVEKPATIGRVITISS